MPLELLEFGIYKTVKAFPSGVAGVAEIDLPVVPVGQTWRIDRVTAVQFTVPGNVGQLPDVPPLAILYDTASPGPTAIPSDITTLGFYPEYPLNDGTPSQGANFIDVDDTSAPITLLAGTQLAIIFPTGNGFTCGVRVQYEVYQGVAGQPQPAAGTEPGPPIPVGL